MAALNGKQQNYHYLDLLWQGAQSPLLDMLNVRYIVVDLSIPADRPDVQAMAKDRKEVYRDKEVVIYENPKVYARAWIVHDVRPENSGEGLSQLATGAVNGHDAAFVDGNIPAVSQLPGGSKDAVSVTSSRPEVVTVKATSAASGMLVLSQIYEKGWHAYLDGKRVDVLKTNGALQGVALPAGEHTVEMRYEPTELRAGVIISGVAGIAMLISFAGSGWFALRRPKASLSNR